MWLLPSRQRPEKLTTFLESAIKTKTSTPGLLLIQHQDYEDNQEKYEALVLPSGWRVHQTFSDTLGGKLNEYWESHQFHHKWIGVLNDDFFVKTPEWDIKLLKHLSIPDIGLISSDDGWQSPMRIHGALLIKNSFLNSIGYIYPPGLQHSFIDDLWENIGRATSCWKVDMSVLVEHRHINKRTWGPADSTWVKAQELFESDRLVWQNWRDKDFQCVCERVTEWQDFNRMQYNDEREASSFKPDLSGIEINGMEKVKGLNPQGAGI